MGGRDPISSEALSKLRWRCRRGMLENDLFVERFFALRGLLSQDDADALTALMQLDDPTLLELFLGHQKPTGHLDRPEVHQVLETVRAPGAQPIHLSRISA